MKSHISVDKLIDNSAVIRKSMINVLVHGLPKGDIANSLFTLYMLSSFVTTPNVSEKSFSFSYLQIAFETSCTWTSFTAVDDITLSRTVRQLIDDMFDRLIRIHGNLLVDHALGYLTVAKFGLTGSILILLLSVKLVFVCVRENVYFLSLHVILLITIFSSSTHKADLIHGRQ